MVANRAVGITLAVVGNVAIAAGLNVQKWVHNRNLSSTVPYYRLRMWWLGMLFLTVGEICNFVAYGFSPATLVAPLGVIGVITSNGIARLLLKEALSAMNWLGVILATAGSALVSVFAPESSHNDESIDAVMERLGHAAFIAYAVSVVIVLLCLIRISYVAKRRYLVVYLLVCSLLGSLTVVCTKGLSSFLVTNQMNNVLPWMMLALGAITAISQVHWLNMAMRYFQVSIVIPPYYVLFTIAAIGGAMILYSEVWSDGSNGYIWFSLGLALTFGGVFLTMYGSKTTKRRDSAEGERGADGLEIPDYGAAAGHVKGSENVSGLLTTQKVKSGEAQRLLPPTTPADVL